MKYKILWTIITILSTLSFTAAIGVTPPRIITDDLLKGSLVEQSVKLVDIEEGNIINIELSGQGSEWLSVKGGSNFIFSKETGDVTFLLDIPKEAPNGDYTVLAQIVVSSSLEKREGANVASIISGVMVEINFRITGDEIKAYSIRNILIPNFETGSPLTVTIDIKNTGNVISRPEKIEIDIKEKISKEIILSDQADAIGNIKPFQTGESIAIFPVNLDEDLYFADVRVHTNNDIIEEKDIPFDVLPPGSLDSSGELIDLFVQDNVESLAKITSIFKNTGKNGLNTIINLDIYKDDILKDTIKTDPQYVRAGQQREFTYSYEIKEKGMHKIKSYAEFNGKKSNEKEFVFEANPQGNSFNKPLIVITIIIPAIAFLSYIKLKKKRKRHDF